MSDRATHKGEIHTPRLRLRRWRPSDRAAFARMNGDPKVMQYFPAPLSPRQSDALADSIEAHFELHGFGRWAVEIPGITSFAGCIGLAIPSFHAHFTPCVEISWRLAGEHWGRGYATEGARAVVAYGLVTLGLSEIVSFTVPANLRSRRVMEKIGMTHNPSDDFDHPSVPEGHLLRKHVLHRITCVPERP